MIYGVIYNYRIHFFALHSKKRNIILIEQFGLPITILFVLLYFVKFNGMKTITIVRSRFELHLLQCCQLRKKSAGS